MVCFISIISCAVVASFAFPSSKQVSFFPQARFLFFLLLHLLYGLQPNYLREFLAGRHGLNGADSRDPEPCSTPALS